MNKDEILKELGSILADKDGGYHDYKISIYKLVKVIGHDIEIEFTDMYHAPNLSFDTLKKLSDYFGTVEIDVDDYGGHGGCETCDYGSCYGHKILIKNPTKHLLGD